MDIPEVPVLIAGAGPVGLIAAYTLAHHGIRCMLVERNDSTTKWPKMDITNVRSMEILRKLGLADELRERGVGQEHSFDVIISTGLGEGGEEITRWDLPSPNQWRRRIKETNDGAMPREPYQRCSQAIFEAWLKTKIDVHPLIDSSWSIKLSDFEENADGVFATLEHTKTGSSRVVKAQYLIGCDGGGSRVRRTLGLGLTGGPLPAAMYLVHFKSRDLSRIHKQGQFWHIFFASGGVIISQDEVDTWTTHLPVPIDFDQSTLDPKEQIFRVLGGLGDPYQINVDEILVSSVWRPNNAVADRYRSSGGRAFIAGDAAHQNIPTGGYGMNTGLGDAYDIAWKLAIVLTGAGGESLLESYEAERRPVAIRNVQRAAEHMAVHQHCAMRASETGPEAMFGNSKEGRETKAYIKEYVNTNDGENKDHGIEMDYRLSASPTIILEAGLREPEWKLQSYSPSTAPGSRSPHVFLSDGTTSIYDIFGEGYTVVDFSKEGSTSRMLEELAKAQGLPVTRLHLPGETDPRRVWERDVVLVRPDHFVAWRSMFNSTYDAAQLNAVLAQAFGRASLDPSSETDARNSAKKESVSFKGVEKTVNQDMETPERLAAFQR